MFHHDQLSQQQQADALLPAHVFPVTGFGTLPETGDKVLPMKLVAAKKEIHRVPAASAVVTSPAMSWPMLNGTLPATSLSTFRLSSAGLIRHNVVGVGCLAAGGILSLGTGPASSYAGRHCV